MKTFKKYLLRGSIILFTSWSEYNPNEFKNNSNIILDRCNEWASTSEYRYLFIKICEYVSGGSGYYQFKNNYNKGIRFSFKIFHNNGNVTKGSTNIKSGKTSRASCFSCAEKNGGGNRSYEISKVFLKEKKDIGNQ